MSFTSTVSSTKPKRKNIFFFRQMPFTTHQTFLMGVCQRRFTTKALSFAFTTVWMFIRIFYSLNSRLNWDLH